MISVWIKVEFYSIVAPRIDARTFLYMPTFYIIPVAVVMNYLVTSAVAPVVEIIQYHHTGYQQQTVQKRSLKNIVDLKIN